MMASRSIVRVAFSIWIGTCFAGNLLGTCFLYDLSDPEMFKLVCYGAGCGLNLGQVTLLAIWGVLSVEPLVIRLPRALALSVLVLYSWLLGATMADPNFPIEISIVISGLAMLFFAILTTPFWVVRWVSLRRVVTQHQVDVPREQFTLRHILIWTAVVAGMTGLGKLIAQSQSEQANGMPPFGILMQMIVMVAIVSLFVAIVGLPAAWGVLTKRPSFLAWSVILAILCFGPPVLHEGIYLVVAQRPFFEQSMMGILAWYAFAVAALMMTVAGLLLARVLGFRFLPVPRRTDRHPPPRTS